MPGEHASINLRLDQFNHEICKLAVHTQTKKRLKKSMESLLFHTICSEAKHAIVLKMQQEPVLH